MAAFGDATLSDRLNPTHPAFDADLKRRWATMPKAERKAIVEADQKAIAARHASVEDIHHPFQTDDDDHCETGAECFADVAPLLAQYAACLLRDKEKQNESAEDASDDDEDSDDDDDDDDDDEKDKEARASLKIYDPYYCTGAVVRHLGKLGFPDVYNRCEDFYAVAAGKRTPEFDVLLTNPAFSGDHIPRLLDFVATEVLAKGRAFALLMPAYVCAKDYYARAVARHPQLAQMAFLCPRKRYVYWTPAGLRSKRQAHSSALGNRTSPFVTFWYLHFGPHHQRIMRWWQAQEKQQRKAINKKNKKKGKGKEAGQGQEEKDGSLLPDCVLARSLDALPKGVRPATTHRPELTAAARPAAAVGHKRRFDEEPNNAGRGARRGGGRGGPAGGGKRFKGGNPQNGSSVNTLGDAGMRKSAAAQGRHIKFD